MPAADPPALYLAHDDTTAIVSRLPLKIRGARADVCRWGPVQEVVPRAAAGHPAAVDTRPGPGVAVLLLFMAVPMIFSGVPWWAAIAVTGAVAGFVVAINSGQRGPGAAFAPRRDARPDAHHVLFADEDRQALSDAVDLAERIVETWPALADLVDTAEVERLLAHALFDLAGVLERRQEVRALHEDLQAQSFDGLPAGSPAVHKLARQRTKVSAALADLDTEVARRLADLTTTAEAGESFVREGELGRLTREVDETLAGLVAGQSAVVEDPATELAARTAAVLDAYRELTARYGGAWAG